MRGRKSSPQGYPATISEPEDRHMTNTIQTKWEYEEICMYFCIHICETQQLMKTKREKGERERLRWREERNKDVYVL